MVGLSRARAIVVGGQGSTYVTGRTSLPYPTTTGAFDRASNGGFDTFVTKLNPTASALAYSTFPGGANSDEAFDLALDGEGKCLRNRTDRLGRLPDHDSGDAGIRRLAPVHVRPNGGVAMSVTAHRRSALISCGSPRFRVELLGRSFKCMPQEELSAYLVEIEPRADSGEAGSLASRARGSANGVRFLRSIYVPEDDRWFLLYEGASAEEVVAAATRTEAIIVSIAEARGVAGEIPELTDVSASSGRDARRDEYELRTNDSERNRRGR